MENKGVYLHFERAVLKIQLRLWVEISCLTERRFFH